MLGDAEYSEELARAHFHLDGMCWEDLLIQYTWWRDKQDQSGSTDETRSHLEVINSLLKVA